MKRYCYYLVLFLALVAANGCIKDDNPYPDIQNTTWKLTTDKGWHCISFSASGVHHEVYEKGVSDSVYTHTDYYADYEGKNEDGRRYYYWVYDTVDVSFKVFSLGLDNIVITVWHQGDWLPMPSWYRDLYSEALFYRDEDPAEGYNF